MISPFLHPTRVVKKEVTVVLPISCLSKIDNPVVSTLQDREIAPLNGSTMLLYDSFPGPTRTQCKEAACGQAWITIFVLVLAVLMTVVLIPKLSWQHQIWAGIGVYGSCGLAFVCQLMLFFSDPGVIERPTKPYDNDVNAQAAVAASIRITHAPTDPFSERDPNSNSNEISFCTRCNVFRPPRSHHCRTCGRCVRQFDHHCGVLGRCIAERNHRWFTLLLCCGATGNLVLLAATVVVLAEDLSILLIMCAIFFAYGGVSFTSFSVGQCCTLAKGKTQYYSHSLEEDDSTPNSGEGMLNTMNVGLPTEALMDGEAENESIVKTNGSSSLKYVDDSSTMLSNHGKRNCKRRRRSRQGCCGRLCLVFCCPSRPPAGFDANAYRHFVYRYAGGEKNSLGGGKGQNLSKNGLTRRGSDTFVDIVDIPAFVSSTTAAAIFVDSSTAGNSKTGSKQKSQPQRANSSDNERNSNGGARDGAKVDPRAESELSQPDGPDEDDFKHLQVLAEAGKPSSPHETKQKTTIQENGDAAGDNHHLLADRSGYHRDSVCSSPNSSLRRSKSGRRGVLF